MINKKATNKKTIEATNRIKKTKKTSSVNSMSTYDEFMAKLTPQQKKEYDEGYKEFLLSELILAAMEHDEVSVRQLARMAGVSPTIVQSMRLGSKNNYNIDTLHKILKSLGFDQFMVGRNGQFINLDLAQFSKK